MKYLGYSCIKKSFPLSEIQIELVWTIFICEVWHSNLGLLVAGLCKPMQGLLYLPSLPASAQQSASDRGFAKTEVPLKALEFLAGVTPGAPGLLNSTRPGAEEASSTSRWISGYSSEPFL